MKQLIHDSIACFFILYLLEWAMRLQLFSGPERCGVYLRAATIRGIRKCALLSAHDEPSG